jgi:hypothetical protein
MFTGSEVHLMDINAAAALTAAYRDGDPLQILGGFFGADAINFILEQPGCVGIRYYYGKQVDGSPTIVMVGADAAGNDILAGINPIVIDMSLPCPRFCSTPNALNS